MTPMAGIWEVLRITADKSLSICADGVFSIGFKKPKQVMENTDIHFSATRTFKATGIEMKRLPISTFYAFLLTVTCLLFSSAIEAKKPEWRTIPASKSGIVINIDGYEFQYRGTGWNANYSAQSFLAKTYEYEQDLSVFLYSQVLAEGYYYDTVLGSLDGYVSRSGFKYRNRSPSIVSRWGGKTNKTDSSDSDQGFVAAKVELNHPTINTCYIVRYIPHWGTTYREEFNPSIILQLCSKGDLNLELSDGKKIFTIDDPNKKIGLNLSYQSLGRKIAALKNPTLSTTSGSVNPFLSTSTRNDSSEPKKPTSTINDDSQTALKAPAPSGSITEKRSIAVQWEGKDSLLAGHITIPKSGTGNITFSIPETDGKCSGTFAYTDPSKGIWSAACTTGETASGSFKGLGAGKGSTGTGKDNEGKTVRFTIGAK
ncbi:MAG: hypothetical protein CBC23_008880 [Rhodospirillaceae bacterium TMED63]|nr:MAG: hypothetical protein CBC23_008880 [Rhodospirillaceae bacterium TMED63]